VAGPDVLRPSPDSEALRQAFTRTEQRRQRQSDGTLVIEAHRFEVPNRYRHLRELHLRYAQWDLSRVYLLDQRSGQLLCRLYPQDKQSNARGVRRALEPLASAPIAASADATCATAAMAPLLAQLIAQQTATGLPPPYLPKDEAPEQS
jgi:hypothetical protein